jgi:hypothetical protein
VKGNVDELRKRVGVSWRGWFIYYDYYYYYFYFSWRYCSVLSW